ncbi:hypothetical protein AB6A40_008412, partial [Gnathostoma spinigerum]
MTSDTQTESFLVFTVNRNDSDGFRRLQRSAEVFNVQLTVLKTDDESAKTNNLILLRKALEKYKTQNNLLILFLNGEDVILNGGSSEIVERFLTEYDSYRIVFAADSECWPVKTLAPEYPLINFGGRYLNSKIFMGYAPEMWQMLNSEFIRDDSDEQTILTNVYLDDNLRNSLEISLDSMAFIFQTVVDDRDIVVEFTDSGDAKIHNTLTNTHPIVVTGHSDGRILLNSLGNYIGKEFSAETGCRRCPTKTDKMLSKKPKSEWPLVTLALFIANPTPFVREFLESIAAIEYPNSLIHLYLFNNQEYNEKEAESFVQSAQTKYRSVKYDLTKSELDERKAREQALELAISTQSDYIFIVDADIHIINVDTLKDLIELSKHMDIGIVAPLVKQPTNSFTNFWGALDPRGFYQRSDDYMDIVKGGRIGVWNVPYITSAILMTKEKVKAMKGAYESNTKIDVDMAFCQYAREKGHFMYVSNLDYYGFLSVRDEFEESAGRLHREMYEIFGNRYLWERRYVHPQYYAAYNGSIPISEPCPDVYDYPLMSNEFAKCLIEEMEHFGQWSSGKNQDDRLVGGYENVPTVDIHMNQIGFERHWLYFLDEFVRPMQEKLFIGYYEQV